MLLSHGYDIYSPIIYNTLLLLSVEPWNRRSFDKSKRAKHGLDDATALVRPRVCSTGSSPKNHSIYGFPNLCPRSHLSTPTVSQSPLERMLIPIQEIMRILIKIENARSAPSCSPCHPHHTSDDRSFSGVGLRWSRSWSWSPWSLLLRAMISTVVVPSSRGTIVVAFVVVIVIINFYRREC